MRIALESGQHCCVDLRRASIHTRRPATKNWIAAHFGRGRAEATEIPSLKRPKL